MNNIKEKYANELQESIQNGASQSDIIAILWDFINEELDEVTRYDFGFDGEVVRHPQGEYVRYDSLHS
jgi:hypothetical protein